jgi:hypothetical protein
MQLDKKISCIQSRGTKEKPRLSLGMHVRKVSEKGKVPRCQYCHGNIEESGI